jgi:hypothetical protein
VLIRSEKGRWVYREALAAGYIKERKYKSISNARSDWMKAHAKVIGFSQKKRERAQRNRAAAISRVLSSRV